jgi:hypothetical protein
VELHERQPAGRGAREALRHDERDELPRVVAVAEIALLELLVQVIERVLIHAGRQRARPQRVPLFGRGRSRCRFRNRRIDVSTILVRLV